MKGHVTVSLPLGLLVGGSKIFCAVDGPKALERRKVGNKYKHKYTNLYTTAGKIATLTKPVCLCVGRINANRFKV